MYLNTQSSEMADREAIRDCIARQALANDMRDAAMWKGVYWPDAHEDHRPMYIGNAHAFVDAVIPMLDETLESTWHQIGSVLIRIDGSSARAVSYVDAHVVTKASGDAASADRHFGVRYLDRLERRGPEWRIIERVVKSDWMTEAQDPDDGAEREQFAPGMRFSSDPMRALLAGGMPGSLLVGPATEAATPPAPASRINRLVSLYHPENLERAMADVSAALGVDFGEVLEPEGMGLRIAISLAAGIELIAPHGDEGAAGQFRAMLVERGEGPFQIVFQVDDLERSTAAARDAGWDAGDMRIDCFKANPAWRDSYSRMAEAVLPPVAGIDVTLMEMVPHGR